MQNSTASINVPRPRRPDGSTRSLVSVNRNLSFEEKFWARVDDGEPDACWPWLGNLSKMGYGRINSTEGGKPRRILAHRAAYEFRNGPIPDGMVIDHKCCTPECVNPNHLQAVDSATNSRLGGPNSGDRSTRCNRGHCLTPENTFYKEGPNGPLRRCAICDENVKRNNGKYREPKPTDAPVTYAWGATTRGLPYADDILPDFEGFDVVIEAWSL